MRRTLPKSLVQSGKSALKGTIHMPLEELPLGAGGMLAKLRKFCEHLTEELLG